MKILFVAAEVAPFATVGGLSQVMYFLPRALIKLGHDVRIFTPKYGVMDKTAPENGWRLQLETAKLKVDRLVCNVKSHRSRSKNPITYFLENQEYYELRANVFQYKDDHVRFALLSKGCLEWLRSKPTWSPDLIHINDWHTGYLVDLARRHPRYQSWLKKTPIVLTVHNFAYQGNFDFRYAAPRDRDSGQTRLAPLLSPKLQKQNALLRGLLYADAINTVSPTHAREVLTPEYGEGLDEILLSLRGKLTGILNGLDSREFNPATDPIIKTRFNSRSFTSARADNKQELQREFSLPEDDKTTLMAISGRLSVQKGWDLLLQALPHLLKRWPSTQLIVLGGGSHHYRQEITKLKEKFPKQVGVHLRPDFRLPRKLFAGADIFLAPSLFEPGGIVALEALRYGAVPLVRRTGGLNDIITDFDPDTGKGNGFSFAAKDPWALYGAMVEAITIARQPKLWHKLVKNCLRADFSWNYSAKIYQDWYQRVRRERRRATGKTPHPAYGPGIPTLKDSSIA